MNILGLVFPVSLFQQAGKWNATESNISSAKYSAAPAVSRPLKGMQGKAAQSVKSEASPLSTGACQKFSDYEDGQCRQSSDLSVAANSALNSSNLDAPIKKKKNKRKGKLKSKQFDDNTALTNVSFADSSAKGKANVYSRGDKANVTNSTREQAKFTEAVPVPAVTTSTIWCKHKVACLNDPLDLETDNITRPSCPDDEDFRRNEIQPECSEIRIHESSENTDEVGFDNRRPNIIQNEVPAGPSDSLIEPNAEALSSSSWSIESMPYPNSNPRISTGEPDVAKGTVSNKVIPGRPSSDSPTAGTNKIVDQGTQFQVPIGVGTQQKCTNSRKRIGKENTYLCWQRTMKNTGGKHASDERLSHDNQSVDLASKSTPSLPQQNSSAHYGLLPPNYAGGDECQPMNLQSSDRKFQRSRHELSDGQYELSSAKYVQGRKVAWKRSKDKLAQSSVRYNFYHYDWGGFWVSKSMVCNPWIRPNLVEKEDSQVSRTSDRSSTDGQRDTNDSHHCAQPSGHQNLLHEVPSHAGRTISDAESISSKDIQLTGDDNFGCLDMQFPFGSNYQEHIFTRLPSKRWVPLGQKKSSTVIHNKDSTAKGVRSTQVQQEHVVQEASSLNGSKGVQQFDGPSNVKQWSCLVGSKNNYSAFRNQTKDASICIGSLVAADILDDAYRLQSASSSIQLVTGCPIAEFEKVLHSIAPVILPGHGEQYGKGSVRNQVVSHLLQYPQALRDVWSWYERPGTYGLEVKAEDSQNSKGPRTDVVSFHAHFVPLLSAIQLFGSSRHSLVGKSSGKLHTAMLEKENPEETSSLDISCLRLGVEEKVSDFNLSSEFGPPDNMEVVFEYFERELPPHRKPFYEKIKELVEVDASNPCFFGDSSMLENARLRDLHPASWFSVAWYPIYRIPDGAFRASFLTYHTLGHWISRRGEPQPAKCHAFSLCTPALGMLSYNTQGECWFAHKRSAEPVFRDGTPIDSSDILRERLRTLEATASLLSTGVVWKDEKKVTNSHPDYEFFIRRGQRLSR